MFDYKGKIDNTSAFFTPHRSSFEYPSSLSESLYQLLKSKSSTNTNGITAVHLARCLGIKHVNKVKKLLDKAEWAKFQNQRYYFISNNNKTDSKNIYCFENPQSLNFTKPVSLKYFDDTIIHANSWRDLYVDFLKVLFDDYPKFFFSMCQNNTIIANKNDALKMHTPVEFVDGLYVEVNRSANNIMQNMRKIIDECNVDYENIVVEYRTPNDNHTINEHKKSVSKDLNIQAFDELANLSGYTFDENQFYNYLKDNFGLQDSTCRHYVLAIKIGEKYASNHNFEYCRFFSCSFKEASNTAKLLFADSDFVKFNQNSHNYFSVAVKKLLGPMSIGIVSPFKDSASSSAEVRESFDTAPFEMVLEKRFIKGFRLNSPIEISKFKKNYEEIHGVPLNIEDPTLIKIIQSCGIIDNCKVFLPKTMLNNDIKEKLIRYIEDSFNSGINSIYFEALFHEFSDDFLDQYVYNTDMLRSYLIFECGDKYVFGKNELSKETGFKMDPVEEVRNYIKSYGQLINKKDLYKNLSHLSHSKIDSILRNNQEFIRDHKSDYFHADMLALSDEEIENIADLIKDRISSHGYISGSELVKAINAKFPHTYDNYSMYSDIGWRDALRYKLGERFSFKGNIISEIGNTLSMSDAFGQLVSEVDIITLDQIISFAKDMGTLIYFEPIYQNALRIDENNFVSKKRAAFNVEETDKILDLFCMGNYISLNDISDFGIFPYAGFPWTVFLLESYVAFYSDRYKLLNLRYNQYSATGAIVKKGTGFNSLDDVIVDVLAHSSISLNKNEALKFLVSSGYIARRSYANIEKLIILAKAQRNKKERL